MMFYGMKGLAMYAFVDKVFLTGPPLAKIDNPTGQGAGNPVKFWSYVFIPKGIDLDKKYPLIVLPHGGVHASFSQPIILILLRNSWHRDI